MEDKGNTYLRCSSVNPLRTRLFFSKAKWLSLLRGQPHARRMGSVVWVVWARIRSGPPKYMYLGDFSCVVLTRNNCVPNVYFSVLTMQETGGSTAIVLASCSFPVTLWYHWYHWTKGCKLIYLEQMFTNHDGLSSHHSIHYPKVKLDDVEKV